MATPQELMQIGQIVVERNNAGNFDELFQQYYADNAVSVEAAPMPDGNAVCEGLDAIKAKSEWWLGAHDVHSVKAEGPFAHGSDRFSVIFDMDVTEKASGERTQMRDIGTYYVENGKIVREEFAYALG